jgi:hypothetical protein
MKLILLFVWAGWAVLGSTKTALKFKHEMFRVLGIYNFGFLEENVRKDKITGANDVYRNRYIAIKKNDFGVEPKKSPTTRIYNEIGYKAKAVL